MLGDNPYLEYWTDWLSLRMQMSSWSVVGLQVGCWVLPGVLYRLAELENADIVLECGRISGGVLGDNPYLEYWTDWLSLRMQMSSWSVVGFQVGCCLTLAIFTS